MADPVAPEGLGLDKLGYEQIKKQHPYMLRFIIIGLEQGLTARTIERQLRYVFGYKTVINLAVCAAHYLEAHPGIKVEVPETPNAK